MRRTKIVATLGPATSSDRLVGELMAAGVDVFRLNFSHGTPDGHRRLFASVRGAAKQAGRHVAVMQDLGGPKIRTGPLARDRPIQLTEGGELVIAAGDFEGEPGRVSTTFAELFRHVRPGDRLLLDDGRIELVVSTVDDRQLAARVVSGGALGAHKGINAPGVKLPASALTEKDVRDLGLGLELGVDLVALSFVQDAADLRRAREVARSVQASVPIVAKIERPAAVANITGILSECDGIMVARGDLGLEMPLEQVPRIQKELTRHARMRGLPVIVATQVFESMRTEPRPTRAEVSDAANAVGDGVDAIMLAGETAVGAFPLRVVQTLDAVIRDAESVPPAEAVPLDLAAEGVHGRALCEAAVTLARAGRADAIVAVTREGRTARLLSALRPQAPIYAATDNPAVASRLALVWGVVPFVTDLATSAALERALVASGALGGGAVVVFVSVHHDLDRPDANFLNLQRIGSGS